MADPLPPLPAGATTEPRSAQIPSGSSTPPLPRGATREPSFSPAPPVESEGIVKKAAPYVAGTGMAAGLGAATPELLTLGGMAAAPFPLTAPLAPYLLSAGQVGRASRLGLAASGGTGFLAGQAARAVTPEPEKPLFSVPGATVRRGEAAEFAGEMVAPLAYKLPAAAVARSYPGRALLAAAERQGFRTSGSEAAANELANLRNRVAINQVLNTERLRVSPNEIANYRKVFDKLQAADADTQARISQEIANAEKQAEGVLRRYSDMAENALKTNKATAQRLINEGDAKAQKIINDSIAESDRKLAVRERAKRAGGVAEEQPQQTLSRVGDANARQADIGGGIQQRISQVVSKEQKDLNDAYIADKKVADDLVRKQESAGIGILDTPAYKDIINYLDQRLNKGVYEGQKFQRTIEPTLIASLTSLRNSLARIKPGVDETGTVVESVGKPPSFKGVDEVRRKLGEVYDGKDVEGFKGITREIAQDLYALVRKAQVEYAGGKDGAFDMLLRNYSEGKDLLNALKIPPGKKIIKTDLINPEYMTYDPSGLAPEFFQSRKKVMDLVTLTKDAAFVEQAAANHVARTLKDADAKGVRQFLDKNDEWLDLMPGLRARVQDHLAALTRAERVVPKTTTLAKTLRTEMQTLPDLAQKEAAGVRKEAAKAAKEAEAAGKTQAKELVKAGGVAAAETREQLMAGIPKFEPLVGKGDMNTQIQKLITEGNTDKLRRAAPIIQSDPKVLQAFREAIKQEISQMKPETAAGSAQLRGEWQSKIRPALLETGLIDAKLAKQIDERIKVAQLAMEPSKAAQTILYILRQAAAGSVGEIPLPEGRK